MIKGWSTTQQIVALSSGEAEYYGIVRGSSIGIGIRSVLADLGSAVRIGVRTDASAAKGIASRRGLGKIRHIEVHQLWVQEKVASGDISISKVEGTKNFADALTKHVDSGTLSVHVEGVSLHLSNTRHEIMPQQCEH